MRRDSSEMWGTKARPAPDCNFDVTPLVDCVFLLLSFFMMTSPMKGNPDRNVPVAAHGIGVNPNGATSIRIVEGTPPRILLDQRESTLEDVRGFVESGLHKGRSLVVIKADKKVPCGMVQQVARAVTSVEGVSFAIGVQDKKTTD